MLNAAYVLFVENMSAEDRAEFDDMLEAEPVSRDRHVADFLRFAGMAE